jgi:hypothetical protein
MSALDDLLARDSGSPAVASGDAGQGSALDSILARDTGGASPSRADIPRIEIRGTSDSQDEPGILQSLGGGLGHGFGSTMLGVQQLAGKALTGMGSTSAGPWLTNDANQGLKRIDSEYAPLSEAHPIIAGTGNVGGMIAGSLLPAGGISKLAPTYSAMGLGGRMALGAGQGAAGAAMMPVADDPSGSYWKTKAEQTALGGGMGAAFPAVMSGASALARGAWNVIQPVIQPQKFVGQGLAGAMNPADAAMVAQNIRSAPQLVPGSIPTTAQAAQTPFMVQTEKAASNLPGVKSGMIQRGVDNNAARWNSLNSVAGSDADLAAAQAARTQASAPLYAAAHQDAAPINDTLSAVMQRPAVQQAMQTADKLAKNEGVQLAWPSAENPTMSGHALDYTSRALGDLIDTATRAGNNQEARALTQARSQLTSWGNSNIPSLGNASSTYARLSVPVNTMEAGQQMSNTLGTRALNATGTPEILLSNYRTAMGQALKGAEHGIDPTAQATLQGIQQDLQRASISNSIRSPGSDTAYNLAANGWLAKNLYGPSFEGATGLGKGVAAGATFLSGHPMAAAGVLAGGNKVGQFVGGRLQGQLGDLLLNPKALLPFLDSHAASAAQPVQGPFMRGLLDYGRPAITSGGSIGLLNQLIER